MSVNELAFLIVAVAAFTSFGGILGWASWPVPGHNLLTGTGWCLFIGFILFLTLWAVSGITLFGIPGG